MKKLLILCSTFIIFSCVSHQPSWQPAPSSEEGVDMYYWDAPTLDPSNQNLRATRMLAHGSSFGPSLIFDVTFNCDSNDPSIQLLQMEVYSKKFAQGHLIGRLLERPDRWESLQHFGRDFQFVYQKTCN